MKYIFLFLAIVTTSAFFIGKKYSGGCKEFSDKSNSYRMAGTFDKAEQSLGWYRWCSILTMQGLGTPYYYHLGWLRADQGRYSESIVSLEKAISIQPEYTWAYWRLGVTYRYVSEYKKSEKYFSKAAEIGVSTLGDEFYHILNNYPDIASDLEQYTSNNRIKVRQ